jgi:tellurite resistance protein TehA-like permease
MAGVLLATMGVGFGLWWALFAAMEHRRLRATGIPFHPGWWGYVFPVAAMALSITAIGAATSVTPVVWLGAAATAGLVVLWAVVAARTVGLLARSR